MIEALEDRRLLSVVISPSIQSVTPVFPQDTPQEFLDLSSFFTDTTTFAPDLKFTAKSDNTGLLNTSVSGSIMTFNFTPGASGYAHVTVTGTNPQDESAAEVVRVKVAAAANRSLDIPLGPARRSFSFRAADGTSAFISLSGPGTGVIHMGGDNLQLLGNHTRGQNQELETISITGSTASTVLLVRGTSHRGKLPVIGDITSDGGFAMIRMKGTTLEGDINAAGPVQRIDMDSAFDGSITLGTSARPMVVHVGTFIDENFSSGAPVRKVNETQWINSDSVSETLATPYVMQLFSLGNFQPGLQLNGSGAPAKTLNHVTVGGLIGGPWRVVGASSPLNVGGVASDFAARFDSLARITDKGSFSGSLSVPSMQSIFIGGTMSQATLDFTAANTIDLRQLVVRGAILSSGIRSAGDLGPIIAQALQGSAVFAGVGQLAPGQALPMSASDLSGAATIRSIELRPTRKVLGFVGSDVAAATIGDLSLGSTRTNNGGIAFGVAGEHIARISARDLTQHRSFVLTNLNDPATLASELAARNLNLGDFKVQVIT